MPRYPVKRTVSAGGVVVEDRPDGSWLLLIARRNTAGDLLWSLPKGRVEQGESNEQAALREVQEETGLRCDLVGPAGTIDYWFVWRDEHVRYHKYVHYYLMRPRGGTLDARDDEADEVAWLPVEEALRTLAYDNERRLVERSGAGDLEATTDEDVGVVTIDSADTAHDDDCSPHSPPDAAP